MKIEIAQVVLSVPSDWCAHKVDEDTAYRSPDGQRQLRIFARSDYGQALVFVWSMCSSLHREDGPAVKLTDGTERWYLYDKLHRDDGPALISSHGYLEWYRHGKLHREDGPAASWPDGTEYWYCDGARHRLGGPAVVNADGTYEWWEHGLRID